MKITSLFQSLFLGIISVIGDKPTISLSELSFYMTPLYYSGQTKIVVTVSKKTVGDTKFKLYLKNELFPDGYQIINATYKNLGTYTYYYDNGGTFEDSYIFAETTSKTLGQKTVATPINVVTSNMRTIDDNKQIISNEPYIFYETSKGFTKVNSVFTFEGFDNFYVPDYYHKLNLSDFKISSNSISLDLLNPTSTLLIKNVNGVFDDIAGASEYAEFNLTLVDENGKKSFSLEQELYVNKETLMMSSEPKSGYVKTKHIYLPRNEMRMQTEFESMIVMRNFGVERSLIYHNFTFKALINTIGDCYNSEYCIVKVDKL